MYLDKIQIGNHVLYLGNCEDIIPTLDNINALVTDIPYEFDTSGGGNFRKRRPNMDAIADNELDKGFDDSIFDLVKEKGCLSYGTFLHWNQAHQISDTMRRLELDSSALLVWQKSNPLPVCNKHYVPELEYFWHGWKKPFGVQGGGVKEKMRVTKHIIRHPVGKSKYDHPTVKPLPVMINMVRNASEEDHMVLDPYMGTGTTGVACVKLTGNRKFIGIESNPKFFDIAVKRMKEAIMQQKWQESMKTKTAKELALSAISAGSGKKEGEKQDA